MAQVGNEGRLALWQPQDQYSCSILPSCCPPDSLLNAMLHLISWQEERVQMPPQAARGTPQGTKKTPPPKYCQKSEGKSVQGLSHRTWPRLRQRSLVQRQCDLSLLFHCLTLTCFLTKTRQLCSSGAPLSLKK